LEVPTTASDVGHEKTMPVALNETTPSTK